MNTAPLRAIVHRLFNNPEAVGGMASFPSPTGGLLLCIGRFAQGSTTDRANFGSGGRRGAISQPLFPFAGAQHRTQRPFTAASLKRNTVRLQNVYGRSGPDAGNKGAP